MSTVYSTASSWPRGSGAIATRIRTGSWSRSPIGPPEQWPTSLRTAIELMLDAVIPTLVLWGEAGTVLYNDRCIPLLGGRHPSLLGTAIKQQCNLRGSRLRDIMLTVLAGDSVIAEDDWLCRPRISADPRHLQLGYSPLSNGHGEITGMWVQVLPAPAVNSAHAHGTVHEARVTPALELETVGIAFFAQDGRITEANSTYLALFGIERADLAAGLVRRGDGTTPEWRTLTHRTVEEFDRTGHVAPHEKECIRPDGHRWWGLFGARRISDAEGVEYVVDVSSGMKAERDLRDSERRMRSLIEGIPQIVWRSGAGGRWTWASPQWTDMTGQPQSQSLDLGWLDRVHPDDRQEACQAWERANWHHSLETNYRLWHIGTNRYRAFQTRAAPVRGEGGRIVEWLGTCTDVEDLLMLHERQRLLVAELQHRTRNLLALVRTIAKQTLRNGESHEASLASFDERLASLSRVQGLLTRSGDELVDLESLLRAELAALREAGASRIHLQGPAVGLSAHQAQALSLAVHELATNALKYGALGTATGHLRIEWSLAVDARGKRSLELSWRERGVALQLNEPRRRGFGHELLEKGLPFSLDAHTELRFEPDGLSYTIELPLPEAEQRRT